MRYWDDTLDRDELVRQLRVAPNMPVVVKIAGGIACIAAVAYSAEARRIEIRLHPAADAFLRNAIAAALDLGEE